MWELAHYTNTLATRQVAKPTLQAIVWGGFIISMGLTIARICIRLQKFRRLRSDDWLVVLALGLLLSSAACYQVLMEPMYEVLRHRIAASENKPLLEPDHVEEVHAKILKFQFANNLLFWLTLWTVKFSFLAFFRRLCRGVKVHEAMWWFVFGFVVIGGIGCIVSYPLSCTTFKNFHSCTNDDQWARLKLSLKYSTAVDAISDIMIILIPMTLIWKVNMGRRQKVALVGVFSLGLIVVLFAIIRVVMNTQGLSEVQPIWLALWSSLETSVAVSVCCLASFKTLFIAKVVAAAQEKVYNQYAYGWGFGQGRCEKGSTTLISACKPLPATRKAGLNLMSATRSSPFLIWKTDSSGSSGSDSSDSLPRDVVHVRSSVHVTHEPSPNAAKWILAQPPQRLRRNSEPRVRSMATIASSIGDYAGNAKVDFARRAVIGRPRSVHIRQTSAPILGIRNQPNLTTTTTTAAPLRTSNPPLKFDRDTPTSESDEGNFTDSVESLTSSVRNPSPSLVISSEGIGAGASQSSLATPSSSDSRSIATASVRNGVSGLSIPHNNSQQQERATPPSFIISSPAMSVSSRSFSISSLAESVASYQGAALSWDPV